MKLYPSLNWLYLFILYVVSLLFSFFVFVSFPSLRFSLLLLEFGEIYFEDFSADYYPVTSSDCEAVER